MNTKQILLLSWYFFVFFHTITIVGCNNHTGQTDPSAIDKLPSEVSSAIDSLITNEMNENHIRGLSVAIANDGEAVFAKGYGIAKAGTPTSTPTLVFADTPFELGSVTKSFTTVGLLLILDNPSLNKSNLGPLNLDSPISQYLSTNPEFPLPQTWENITKR